MSKGIIVAGGDGQGSGLSQLSKPLGLYVDDDLTIYVADWENSRIMEWKCDATIGQIVAGGNGDGSQMNQLKGPTVVIVDKPSNSFIICDSWNNRVMRWLRQVGTNGEVIMSNINCWGLATDDRGFFYITDAENHSVKRFIPGDSLGTVVAGGNGQGNRLDQLNTPKYLFIDRDYSIYVSDRSNHRVMKWIEGAKQGIVVAGGQGEGNSLTQLSRPQGVVVDQLGTVYVADYGNNRVMRWIRGAARGTVIV
ncbi:unnamed protein product, partial [Rotaria sp. Silwood2]